MRVVNLDDPREKLLPADFERMYELLWHQSLRGLRAVNVGDPIGKAKGRRVVRLTTNQVETRAGADPGHKATSSDPLGNEAALAFKSKVDRKLRKLGREIKQWLDQRQEGVHADVRRCSYCKQYGEPEWTYCPKDGKPMQSA